MNSDIEINHQWSLFTPLGAKRDGTKRTQADENRNRTIFKTIVPIKLILNQKGYTGAEKLNMYQLRMY